MVEVYGKVIPACFINSYTSWAVKFVAVTPKALAMCYRNEKRKYLDLLFNKRRYHHKNLFGYLIKYVFLLILMFLKTPIQPFTHYHQSANQPAIQPTSQSINQSLTQLIWLAINLTTSNQLINQPTTGNQSIKTINQWNRCNNQPINKQIHWSN